MQPTSETEEHIGWAAHDLDHDDIECMGNTRPTAFVLSGLMAAVDWISHAPQSFYPAPP